MGGGPLGTPGKASVLGFSWQRLAPPLWPFHPKNPPNFEPCCRISWCLRWQMGLPGQCTFSASIVCSVISIWCCSGLKAFCECKTCPALLLDYSGLYECQWEDCCIHEDTLSVTSHLFSLTESTCQAQHCCLVDGHGSRRGRAKGHLEKVPFSSISFVSFFVSEVKFQTYM